MTNPLELARPTADRAESNTEVPMAHKEVFETMESLNKTVLADKNKIPNAESSSEPMSGTINFENIWTSTLRPKALDGVYKAPPTTDADSTFPTIVITGRDKTPHPAGPEKPPVGAEDEFADRNPRDAGHRPYWSPRPTYQDCVKKPAGFENNKWINPPHNPNRYARYDNASCANSDYQFPQERSPNPDYDNQQNRFAKQAGNDGLPGAYLPFPGTVPSAEPKSAEAPPVVVAPTKPDDKPITINEPASAPKLNSLGLSSGW